MLSLAVLLMGTGAASGASSDADYRWIHRDGASTLPQLLKKEVASAKKARKSVVVMFTADWCAPCKAVKEWLEGSEVVAKATSKGRFVFIDVDEWRGPAHQLFPGVNPRKLPTLVSLDTKGTMLRSVRGTELGLLSEKDTATNLKRLIQGKVPLPASYEGNQEVRMQLIRESAKRSRAATENWVPVEAKVVGKAPPKGKWASVQVDLTIRNKDSRRKWIAIGTPGLAPEPAIESWVVRRFTEHVRAYSIDYVGYPSFRVVPIGGPGKVVLKGLELRVGPGAENLEIWELRTLEVDGKKQQFDKKVPYTFEVENAQKTKVFMTEEGQPLVRLTPSQKHSIPLVR